MNFNNFQWYIFISFLNLFVYKVYINSRWNSIFYMFYPCHSRIVKNIFCWLGFPVKKINRFTKISMFRISFAREKCENFRFSQTFALICFAKKCGIFAKYKMCQFLYLMYTLCFYYSTWCIHYMSTTLPDVYTIYLLLYLIYPLCVYYSTWCIYYVSTTLPDVSTMHPLFYLMYPLCIHYSTWCIHYVYTNLPWCIHNVSTTLPDVHTMHLLLYLMYTLCIYYSTSCIRYVSTNL